jgi:hypothetical protein
MAKIRTNYSLSLNNGQCSGLIYYVHLSGLVYDYRGGSRIKANRYPLDGLIISV